MWISEGRMFKAQGTANMKPWFREDALFTGNSKQTPEIELVSKFGR